VNGTETRLLEALERFAGREIEEFRKTSEEIREALQGSGEEPGLIHIVRREILPLVKKHDEVLFGEGGKGGVVFDIHNNSEFVTMAKRIGMVIAGALVVQVIGYAIWLTRVMLSVSSGGG